MLFLKKHARNLFSMPVSVRDGKTSTHEFISAIKTYLERPNTQYAVMIDGDWGAGKTYFYNTEIKPLVENYQSIYISLFGLKSIQDIEDEIFKTLSIGKQGRKGRYEGILSLYPEIIEDVKVGGTGYVIQFLINQWALNSTGTAAPFVLCLDDLERWQGNLSVCLSYINKLVEHENAKCILIGNLSALQHNDQKGFEEAKDKTIGHVYKLENETKVIFDAALSLINFKNKKSGGFIKLIIDENHHQLSTILNQSNHRNIRTISEAIQLYEYIFNENIAALTSSRQLAFYYFCSLLATLILFKKYFVNYEIREKLLNGYNSSNQGYAFLQELGYFDEDKVDYITPQSKFLLETIFFRADKISLTGLFSIVKKGFYDKKDFENDFQKWEDESPYESYLDTHSLCLLDDVEFSKIVSDVLHSIFEKKEITNPATLLLLAEHLANDIKSGVIDLKLDQLKGQFIELFEELYEEELIDKTIVYDLNFGNNHFVHCHDVYEIVVALNKEYITRIENHNLSNFWLEFKNKPQHAISLLDAFRYEPIFSIYYNPKEVIDALVQLDNSQLFEMVKWLGSRNHDSQCIKVRVQERERAGKIADYINRSYENKFGMQAGHLKKVAKLLTY